MGKAKTKTDLRSLDPYDEQQDLHCWLTFMGWDWKIDEMCGLRRISLVRQGQDGVLVYGMVNLAQADLDAYCRAASSWVPGFGLPTPSSSEPHHAG